MLQQSFKLAFRVVPLLQQQQLQLPSVMWPSPLPVPVVQQSLHLLPVQQQTPPPVLQQSLPLGGHTATGRFCVVAIATVRARGAEVSPVAVRVAADTFGRVAAAARAAVHDAPVVGVRVADVVGAHLTVPCSLEEGIGGIQHNSM
ncbi:hypothetical protein L917_17670 [Phytophthora nicotianae]|uniref:Uncharacterized protein n=1 Tax=Phytophthora nicotianae TaxID=4792 RepID=W2KCN0_PHYNI|nr:hypothetical protein L917_17670 [Phytophthora nicotianae]